MSAPYASTVMTGNAGARGDDPPSTPRGGASSASSDRSGSRPDRRSLLLTILGAGSISASAILVKLAGTPAATTAFFRCFLALPVLVALAAVEQRRHGPRLSGARAGAFLAGLFLAVDLVLWNHAIAEVGAGIATVLGNMQVVFIALTAWVLLRELPERRLLIALPVVMAGVVIVSELAGAATGGVPPPARYVYRSLTSVAHA